MIIFLALMTQAMSKPKVNHPEIATSVYFNLFSYLHGKKVIILAFDS